MMKLGFVLVLVLAAAESRNIEKRIVGSRDCKENRQYHVQVESTQRRNLCGGSLINPRWVITASHCAEQEVKVELGLNMDRWTKTKVFFKGSKKQNKQVIKTDQQFTYKDEEDRVHDIMLIKLNADVDARLPAASLPPVGCTKLEPNQQVQVGGWGPQSAESKAKPPGKLQCASTDMMACGENDKPDSKYHSEEDTTMCAFKPGVESCFGDAGTAVEYNGLLHGIIVSNPVDKCANPIVMLNICHYREWIDKIMRENP